MTTDNRANEPTDAQEPSRLPDFFAPKPMPNSYVPAPVLPSSGIDEDALAEVIEAEIEKLRHETRLYPDIYKAEVAHAVAEWLRTQGGFDR